MRTEQGGEALGILTERAHWAAPTLSAKEQCLDGVLVAHVSDVRRGPRWGAEPRVRAIELRVPAHVSRASCSSHRLRSSCPVRPGEAHSAAQLSAG